MMYAYQRWGIRCADDSYGSYKSRAHREVGKYNRTKSDTNILRVSNDVRAFRHDQPGREGAETPNKPPRRKLETQLQGSPSGRAGSPSMPASDNPAQGQMPAPQVPTFSSAEVSNVQHAPKSVAKPLQALSVQKLSSSPSTGGVVSTVVQKPASGTDEVAPSVRDRIKSIEVFSHSPGSGNISVKSETSAESGVQQVNTDSLEQLESSIKSSNSFRDRLRPVVRKIESEINEDQNQNNVPHDSNMVSGDVPDKFDSPPQVPSRSYRQVGNSSAERPPRPFSKPSERADPVSRKANVQNHSPGLTHPRPYENKPGAHVHSPVGPNHYKDVHKSPSPKESQRSPGQSAPPSQRSPGQSAPPTQRSPGQSVPPAHRSPGQSAPPAHRSPGQSRPEPQVPSRQPVQRRLGNEEITNNDKSKQDENLTSPEVKLASHHTDNNNVRGRDHMQNQSVHIAQKRNYNSSFPSPKSQTEQLPSQSHYRNSSHSPNNRTSDSTVDSVHNQQNRSHPNTQRYSDNMSNHSHRRDNRGNNSSKQRQSLEIEPKSPTVQTTTYHGGDFRHWKSESSQPQFFPSDSPQSRVAKTTDSPQTSPVHSKDNSEDKASIPLVSVNHGRQPSAEELDCDLKAQELAKVLKESDRALSQVLATDSNKIRMQYLDGILPVDENPEQRRPRTASVKEDRVDKAEKEKELKDSIEPTSPMPSNYYVSPPKAMIELEIRKFGDTSQLTQDIEDNDTLAQKKEELLQRMIKKLDVLKDDKKELTVDIEENESLGKQVSSVVDRKCRSQQEKDKYKAYIEDMDKIIRLLLKLSGLLARAENTIQGLNENTSEKIKKMTFDKRDRLHQQHEDAKELKTDIDRRSEQIENFLRESLTQTELDDYHYYIKMKSKYTIQMQELEDKITLGNEQILALQKSIPAKNKT